MSITASRITDTRSTRCHWYALHSKPLKEYQVATLLGDLLDVNVYLPEVKRYFRGHVQRAPLFPRYLFVQADLHVVPPSHMSRVPGVLRLVTFDTMPHPVPSSVIDAIRQQIDSLNAQGGLADHGFRIGDVVRLKEGALRGLEAVFAGPMSPSERVRILLEFLGELREIEVHVGMLNTCGFGASPKSARGTRGNGRRIRNK